MRDAAFQAALPRATWTSTRAALKQLEEDGAPPVGKGGGCGCSVSSGLRRQQLYITLSRRLAPLGASLLRLS